MNKLQTTILNDCEAELELLRDTGNMNKLARDVLGFSFGQLDRVLTNQELSRYKEVIPEQTNEQRKSKIKQWLIDNPAMRTLDTNTLYQRYYFWKRGLGDISKNFRMYNTRPLADLIYRHKYGNYLNTRARAQIQQEKQALAQIAAGQNPLIIQPQAQPQEPINEPSTELPPEWIEALQHQEGLEDFLIDEPGDGLQI